MAAQLSPLAQQASSGPAVYDSGLGEFDFGAALQQGALQRQARDAYEAQQRRALQQQATLDAARNEAINKPTLDNFNRLLLLDPQSHEAIKSAWSSKSEDQRNTDLREITALDGLIAAGEIDQAKARVQRRIDADKAAGFDIADDQEILDVLGSDNPAAARLYTGALLTGVLGDKAGSVLTARQGQEKLPGEIAKTGAETAALEATEGKTLAEAGKIAAETGQIPLDASAERNLKDAQRANIASQIDERAARLDLDRDRLQTTTQLELDKLYGKGTPLSGTAEKSMTDAVLGAESSRALATRADDLATRLDTANLSGGWGAWLAQNASGAFGNPNLLRKEYQALISSQAVKNLPPGPASDKDIQLAMKGFPSATANKETLQSFLRGMAKLQTISANKEQARADWISENGNLGRATRDITVNGVRVPKGANFGDFSAGQSAAERRDAVKDRGYMRFSGGD